MHFFGSKFCAKCRKAKPTSEFKKHRIKGKMIIDSYCKECDRKRWNDFEKEQKEKLFRKLGSQCKCCGERRFEFLTVDHINGKGHEHRRKIKRHGGNTFYRYLLTGKEDLSQFQLLCWNCNCAKGHSGLNECPHERERREDQDE